MQQFLVGQILQACLGLAVENGFTRAILKFQDLILYQRSVAILVEQGAMESLDSNLSNVFVEGWRQRNHKLKLVNRLQEGCNRIIV